MSRPTVCGVAWPRTELHYGSAETYQLAADWLRDCPAVADWGGASGAFRAYLPETSAYTCVDGTLQMTEQVLADLCVYQGRSDGILLRHVIDNTSDWRRVLKNALRCFRRRLVVVTFTPDAARTHRIRRINGWPTWEFNPADVRAQLGKWLVYDRAVTTTHPERIYYCRRGLV